MKEMSVLEKKPEIKAEKGLKKNKKLIFCFITVVLMVAILFLGWLFQKRSLGTISILPPPQKTEMSPPQEKKRYEGKYISFLYPASFASKSFDIPLKEPLLERLYLSKSDIEGQKIALVVQDNTGSRLEEFSSYRMRELDPTVYTKEKIQKNGLSITLFSKKTIVFEVGAYFIHDEKAASLVISSPIRFEGLREELLDILSTVQWEEKRGS